jgi:hypothetical protein
MLARLASAARQRRINPQFRLRPAGPGPAARNGRAQIPDLSQRADRC